MKKLNTLFAAILCVGSSAAIIGCKETKMEQVAPSQIKFPEKVYIMDENPVVGQAIGTPESSTNIGTLTFSIYSQSHNGAVSINKETGALSVANPSLFDYEKTPTIDVVVIASNGKLSQSTLVTINLNNLDDIEFLLTTSKTAYKNATAGSWIEVTETEYNTLATKLNYTTKAGVADSLFTKTASHSYNSGGYSWSNSLGVAIPAKSYVFGFKYLSAEDGSTSATVKASTTGKYAGFSNVGNALPAHNQGTKHFILKGSNTLTGNATGYLSMYFDKGIRYFYDGGSGLDLYMQWENGDASNIPNSSSGILLYQGLTTTQRQW